MLGIFALIVLSIYQKIRVVRKRLRFWYKKYFFTIIDEFKSLINQDF
ncbi:MAG: hypothetical protein OHM57_07360 [Spiroplasma phoeniceum]|nr:MAG: hypothetical protein OHM57_07360 [Spiroplasma phoeniceum]